STLSFSSQLLLSPRPSPLFPYTTLFRSAHRTARDGGRGRAHTDNHDATSHENFPVQFWRKAMKTRSISRRDVLLQGSLAVAGLALLRMPGLAEAFSVQRGEVVLRWLD